MTPLSKALLFHIFPDRGLGERDVGRLQRNYSFIGVCVKDNKISAFKTNNMNEFGYRHATEQEIYSIFEKQIALLSSPGALQAIRSVCYSHFPISPTASPDVIRLRQSIQKKWRPFFAKP